MTHIRSLQDLVMAHHSSAASRSSFTSYFAPHILSMSSDGCSDIADIPQHAAYNESHSPPPGSQSGSPTGAEIASTLWLLSIGTLPINSAEFAKATSVPAVPQSNTPFPGNANHSQVEAQAAAGGLTTTQCEELGAPWGQYDSCHPDYKLDLRPCPQCHGPMEYCHGQNSLDPVLIPAPRSPIFVPPPATSARGMAQVCGPHTEAAVLAAQIACLIREDNEDIIEIPEPPFYPTNKRPA